MRGTITILFLILVSSCSEPEKKSVIMPYIDIKGFFESEVSRLTQNKTRVNKLVEQNGSSEIKNNLTVDWKNELSLFMASDINKPSWRDAYQITKSEKSLLYAAIDTNLRTRTVEIKQNSNGKPIYLRIENITRNNLYESLEELIYITDSTYTINKIQKVRFLGKNSYKISGLLVQ